MRAVPKQEIPLLPTPTRPEHMMPLLWIRERLAEEYYVSESLFLFFFLHSSSSSFSSSSLSLLLIVLIYISCYLLWGAFSLSIFLFTCLFGLFAFLFELQKSNNNTLGARQGPAGDWVRVIHTNKAFECAASIRRGADRPPSVACACGSGAFTLGLCAFLLLLSLLIELTKVKSEVSVRCVRMQVCLCCMGRVPQFAWDLTGLHFVYHALIFYNYIYLRNLQTVKSSDRASSAHCGPRMVTWAIT